MHNAPTVLTNRRLANYLLRSLVEPSTKSDGGVSLCGGFRCQAHANAAAALRVATQPISIGALTHLGPFTARLAFDVLDPEGEYSQHRLTYDETEQHYAKVRSVLENIDGERFLCSAVGPNRRGCFNAPQVRMIFTHTSAISTRPDAKDMKYPDNVIRHMAASGYAQSAQCIKGVYKCRVTLSHHPEQSMPRETAARILRTLEKGEISRAAWQQQRGELINESRSNRPDFSSQTDLVMAQLSSQAKQSLAIPSDPEALDAAIRVPRENRQRTLYMLWCDYDRYASLKLLHTGGSPFFQKRVQEAAAEKGWALLPERGLVEIGTHTVVPDIYTEEQVFERLGLPYVHPMDR